MEFRYNSPTNYPNIRFKSMQENVIMMINIIENIFSQWPRFVDKISNYVQIHLISLFETYLRTKLLLLARTAKSFCNIEFLKFENVFENEIAVID